VAIDWQKQGLAIAMPELHRPARLIIIISIVIVQGESKRQADHGSVNLEKYVG